jgi:hypothetical protein
LFIETLEPRLALTWAGIPPISITPPSAPVALTLNAQHDASGTASIATTEVDYYSFTATATGSYTISALTPTSTLDTVIGIFSATGQRLAYNDDLGGTNSDSRVTLNLSAGSKYFLGVTNYSSTSRGAYNYTINGSAPIILPDDSYENNDTFGSSFNLGTLSANRTISGLKLADASDWYRFTTVAPGTSASSVSISFTNSQGNLQLALFNASGAQLATSLTTGNKETISLNGRAAGTYYVRVYGNAGVHNPNYSLSIVPPQEIVVPPTGGFTISLVMTGITPSQQAIFNQAAARWSQVIIGDLPNATYLGQTVDDLLIAASAIPIDGPGATLGQATWDAIRPGSLLPYHGYMEFDTADIVLEEQSGTLFATVLHEMGHVLGIGTLWEAFGLLSGAGTADPTFTGPQATAAYNQIFGTTATGVPVHNADGPGSRDSHWLESLLQHELMTPFAGPGLIEPLSRITAASLADMGYSVNMAAADPFTQPTGVVGSQRIPVGSGGPALRAAFGTQSTVSNALMRFVSSVDTRQVEVFEIESPKEIRVAPAWNDARAAARNVLADRRPAFNFQTPRFNEDVVDAAITSAEHRAEVELSEDVFAFDPSEDSEFSQVWEDFGSIGLTRWTPALL